jgi:hypothetical protein
MSAKTKSSKKKKKTNDSLDVDRNIFAALQLNEPKFSPTLWFLSDSVSPKVREKIEGWHRDQGKTKKGGVAADDIVATVAELTESQAGGVENAASLDNAVLALAAVHGLSQAPSFNEGDLVWDQLWDLSAAAQRSDSITLPLIKSIGLEIGITLCFVVGDDQKLSQRFLVEEFESLIESNLDNDGWPDSRLLPILGAVVGSWARCFHLLDEQGVLLEHEIRMQLEWLVRQCLRLRSSGGGFCVGAMGVGDSKNGSENFWRCLVAMSEDRDDQKIAKFLNGKSKSLSYLQAGELAEPYNVSEWAGTFLLRSTWSPKSPRLMVDYSSNLERSNDYGFLTEVSRSVPLVSGQTMPEISFSGNVVEAFGGFEVICERSDDDLDYIETQIELSDGGRLNRQWLLSRTDEFLLVADSVVPAMVGKIDYRCRWPLAADVTTMAETETSEIYLQDRQGRQKIQALVMPLSLPEWKAERSAGSLVPEANQFELKQSSDGVGLYAALLFDLNPGRSKKKRTWRQLTVSEDRQILPADVAAAFRFQLNNDQWFFYRAIASTGNRTFLGENVIAEFVLNRFKKDGEVESLIEVQ